MLLFEFFIMFVVHGQAIVDYLADQWLNDSDFSEFLFPDEDVLVIEAKPNNVELWCWKLYFDGVANSTRNGVGAVVVSTKG